MESRGYKPSPMPDLLLDFNGKFEERTDIETTPGAMYGPGLGYGGWYGAPWGGVEGIVSTEMLRNPRGRSRTPSRACSGGVPRSNEEVIRYRLIRFLSLARRRDPAGEVWYIWPSLAIWITTIPVRYSSGVRRGGDGSTLPSWATTRCRLRLDGPRSGVHLVPGAYRASRMPAQNRSSTYLKGYFGSR